MRTRKVSVVFSEDREQYRITLPKRFCRNAHLQKRDKILLMNSEMCPYFFVLIPEILYNRMPHLREQIEEFLQQIGGETL